MSERNITVEKNKIVIKPLTKIPTGTPVVIRNLKRLKVLPGNINPLLLKNLKGSPTATSIFYKEDIIYESKQGDFLGDSHRLKIVNKLNLHTKESRTIATYLDHLDGKVFERTSDEISRVIGQTNYNTILSALTAENLTEELKVKGILALLRDTTFEDRFVQTNMDMDVESNDISGEVKPMEVKKEKSEDKSCQTSENSVEVIYKMKPKRIIKRSITPYAVKDNTQRIKKVTVNPDNPNDRRIIQDLDKKINFETKEQIPDTSQAEVVDDARTPLPVLQIDDDSNDNSDILSNFSADTVGLKDCENKILNIVGELTSEMKNLKPYLVMIPGLKPIRVAEKPQDFFHLATKEILESVSPEERQILLKHQAVIDAKLCLVPNDIGYLPLHIAVYKKDVSLVSRQCFMLRKYKQTPDILAGDQISVERGSPACTAVLLQYGADLFYEDEQDRNIFHLAAENEASDHLAAILNHCRRHAREILMMNSEQLWQPNYETKTNEELSKILLKHLCEVKERQGYTALMLACNIGHYTNVKMLVEACPDCVNFTRPGCGSTALSLTVAQACVDAANRGNTSKVADNFRQTITILLDNGANPSIPNHYGSNVTDLLAELNNTELSMLFADRNGVTPPSSFDKYMYVKTELDISLHKIKKDTDTIKSKKTKSKKIKQKQTFKSKTVKSKPIIIENKVLPSIKIPAQRNTNVNTENITLKVKSPKIPLTVAQVLQTPITVRNNAKTAEISNLKPENTTTVEETLKTDQQLPKRKLGNTPELSKKKQ